MSKLMMVNYVRDQAQLKAARERGEAEAMRMLPIADESTACSLDAKTRVEFFDGTLRLSGPDSELTIPYVSRVTLVAKF